MKKNYLLAPGPSQVPPETLLKMAAPIYHHRTPQFGALLKEASERLQRVFFTKNPCIIIASSGTGAMETSVVNILARGEKALVVKGGKFGERFAEIAAAYGLETVDIDVEWGSPVDPAVIRKTLDGDPAIAAVYATLVETSTGVVNDIKAIGEIVAKTGAVFVVDGISGVGGQEIRVDDWHVDILVVGSQKALMLPPGLAFMTVSEKAKKKALGLTERPAYYFDLKKALKKAETPDTPYTPAVALVEGLNTSLKMLEEEGMENVFARHRLLAEATRAGVKALGLELFSKAPADVVTAIRLPGGIDGAKVPKKMRDEFGVTIAGGQEAVKGKICRIAHMGFAGIFDVIVGLSAFEMALAELGADVSLGAGVRAAQEVFLKSRK